MNSPETTSRQDPLPFQQGDVVCLKPWSATKTRYTVEKVNRENGYLAAIDATGTKVVFHYSGFTFAHPCPEEVEDD